MQTKKIAYKDNEKSVEMFPGAFRTTLTYNDTLMLCHFFLKKGAVIPLHKHVPVQNGYLVSGKVQLDSEDGSKLVIEPGASYVFDSNEVHGATALEDSVYVETFYPVRPEYYPQ